MTNKPVYILILFVVIAGVWVLILLKNGQDEKPGASKDSKSIKSSRISEKAHRHTNDQEREIIKPKTNIAEQKTNAPAQGMVVDLSGNPIEGAEVFVKEGGMFSPYSITLVYNQNGTLSDKPIAITDESGKFTLPRFRKDKAISAFHKKTGGSYWRTLRPNATEIQLKLNPLGELEYHLVNQDNKPIPGVLVSFFETSGTRKKRQLEDKSPSYSLYFRAKTDKSGKARLVLPGNIHLLPASVDQKIINLNGEVLNRIPVRQVPIQIRSLESVYVKAVEHDTVRVWGRVVDEWGNPIAKAEVEQYGLGKLTDGEGRFSFDMTLAMETPLGVHAEGFEDQDVKIPYQDLSEKNGMLIVLKAKKKLESFKIFTSPSAFRVLLWDPNPPQVYTAFRRALSATRCNDHGLFEITYNSNNLHKKYNLMATLLSDNGFSEGAHLVKNISFSSQTLQVDIPTDLFGASLKIKLFSNAPHWSFPQLKVRIKQRSVLMGSEMVPIDHLKTMVLKPKPVSNMFELTKMQPGEYDVSIESESLSGKLVTVFQRVSLVKGANSYDFKMPLNANKGDLKFTVKKRGIISPGANTLVSLTSSFSFRKFNRSKRRLFDQSGSVTVSDWPGKYCYLIEATGYEPAFGEAEIISGAVTEISVSLIPKK